MTCGGIRCPKCDALLMGHECCDALPVATAALRQLLNGTRGAFSEEGIRALRDAKERADELLATFEAGGLK